MRFVAPLIAVASVCVLWGVFHSGDQSVRDPIVARWDGLEITAGDLELARQLRPNVAPKELVVELFIDMAIARRVAAEPKLALRARAAERAAAISLLLDGRRAGDVLAESEGSTPSTRPLAELPDDAVVAAAGDDQITAREARVLLGPAGIAGPGGQQSALARLQQELQLWRMAVKRGLDRRPRVRAARRAALLAARQPQLAGKVRASISEAQLRANYRASLGDFTTSRRVQISALTTRDRALASRWARQLARARFPATRFDQLAAASEDRTSKGAYPRELGWIDAKSTHVPAAFRQVALRLSRPGQPSGVLSAGGAYHVLLCRDFTPATTKPFDQVREQILENHVRRQLGPRLERERKELRDRIDPQFDRKTFNQLTRTRRARHGATHG